MWNFNASLLQRIFFVSCIAFGVGVVFQLVLSGLVGGKIILNRFSLSWAVIAGTTCAIMWLLFIPLVKRSGVVMALFLGATFPIGVSIFGLLMWCFALVIYHWDFSLLKADPRGLFFLFYI